MYKVRVLPPNTLGKRYRPQYKKWFFSKWKDLPDQPSRGWDYQTHAWNEIRKFLKIKP